MELDLHKVSGILSSTIGRPGGSIPLDEWRGELFLGDSLRLRLIIQPKSASHAMNCMSWGLIANRQTSLGQRSPSNHIGEKREEHSVTPATWRLVTCDVNKLPLRRHPYKSSLEAQRDTHIFIYLQNSPWAVVLSSKTGYK